MNYLKTQKITINHENNFVRFNAKILCNKIECKLDFNLLKFRLI